MRYQPDKWMLRIEGVVYPFLTFSKNDVLSCKAGVYILGYTHVRGHLAGFQLNILHVTTGIDFQDALSKVPDVQELEKAHWNSVYVYETDASQKEQCMVVQGVTALSSPIYSS